MVRKTTATVSEEVQESKSIAAEAIGGTPMEEKLDLIVLYLHRMDRRDRIRTVGGFVRGMLGLIPLILLVWSYWYFLQHGEEFMKKITSEAVRQSAEYSQGSLMEQLEGYMNEGR
jgi:hypothetical protein